LIYIPISFELRYHHEESHDELIIRVWFFLSLSFGTKDGVTCHFRKTSIYGSKATL